MVLTLVKVDALAFLHSLSIVHRNVKAENVWIQADGHVVLGDFSYAKELPSRTSERVRSYSNCGTREHQPPEMILGWGYDYAVDCWGFGIILSLLHLGHVSSRSYRLLYGCAHLNQAPVWSL